MGQDYGPDQAEYVNNRTNEPLVVTIQPLESTCQKNASSVSLKLGL